jgi:hypothetical protein
MGTSDNGDIHLIGEDGEGQWWTACGMRAETMPCILALAPTCPDCLEPS